MPVDITSILEALEKPLKFASRSNYSNIEKVKALNNLVEDLALKALSLSLSPDQLNTIEIMRSLFENYEYKDKKQKREVIANSLEVLEKLKRTSAPSASGKNHQKVLKPEKSGT